MTRPVWPSAIAVLVVLTAAFAACGGEDSDHKEPPIVVADGVIVEEILGPDILYMPVIPPSDGCPQGPNVAPASYYGFGLEPGALVVATNTTPGCEMVCEQSVVSGTGFWIVRIAGDNECGVREGHVISFTVDGKLATQSEIWRSGGVPDDVTNGISLDIS